MPGPKGPILICCAALTSLTACEAASVVSKSAASGAAALGRAGSDIYAGLGGAARQPLRDLNLAQDPIPTSLLRADQNPYDTSGVTSCEAVRLRVAELDLALGPDLDLPRDRAKSRLRRGASEAAEAALEAAAGAAEGFLPVRWLIKRVSGATQYEAHFRRAIVAGIGRRAFLKGIGAVHHCPWPSQPLTIQAASTSGVLDWPAPDQDASAALLLVKARTSDE